MDLVLSLPAEVGEKLRQHAASLGQDVKTFAIKTLEQKLYGPRTLDEILAPFREQVAQSGMTDAELDDFYEELRDEAWQNRQSHRP